MTGTLKNIPFSNDGNLAFDDLLKGMAALETSEIVQFMHEMGRIVATRKVSVLSIRETELLKKINTSIPEKLQKTYQSLTQKLNKEIITELEHQELLKIITKIEQKKAIKLEYMIELARLRNISLRELGQQLQINQAINQNND